MKIGLPQRIGRSRLILVHFASQPEAVPCHRHRTTAKIL